MRHIELVMVLLLGFMFLGFISDASSLDGPIVMDASAKQHVKMHDGIIDMRGHFKHVNSRYANRLVREATEVTQEPGNTWMPPHILLGLAINESDLRWWIVTGSKTKPDCGLCQNHTPLFAKSIKARYALCKRLTKSTKLSFQYAMKELNTIRTKWCLRYFKKPVRKSGESTARFKKRMTKWKFDQYRCILNIYNQGPRYVTSTCKSRLKKRNYPPSVYKYKMRRCKIINKYWLRSLCFSKGLELGRKGRKSCRQAWSLRWIEQNYRQR